MKQLFIKKGEITIEDVPAPIVGKGTVLVKTLYSCISSGTEMAEVAGSSKPLYKRVIEQPKKINKVLKMVKDSGLSKTISVVRGILDTETPMGYSAAGQVIEVGEGITDIAIGDKVACAGGSYAVHAEFINVPRNLVVKAPDDLNMAWMSTVALGAIALQGVRRASPSLGEVFVVFGLGFLGQVTAQLLKINGCRVVGIDIDKGRMDVAKYLGIEIALASDKSVVETVKRFTGGYGADGIIVTAATESDELISQAFKMCRKKGRVVVVGDVGLNINREDIYEKELDFFISTSYGPGRYDVRYEKDGLDYPVGYVRWTENRNMVEYIKLLAENRINLAPLISKEFLFNEAPLAYKELSETKPLQIVLKYDDNKLELSRKINISSRSFMRDRLNVAVVGLGAFAKECHLPNLARLSNKYNIYAVMSQNGGNAKFVANQYNAKYASTDYREIIADPDIDLVVVSTKHDTHAKIATEAAIAGKAVFLEKPMAMNRGELGILIDTLEKTEVPFSVGFNRRFSVFAKRIKETVKDRMNPMLINYRMNAGFIPKDHWINTREGGGRNVGEACHIYDLFNYFTDSEKDVVFVSAINPSQQHYNKNDNFIATIKYKDGSVCNLVYTALGSSDVSKEQMEIYVDGKIICLDDFKTLEIFGGKGPSLNIKHPEKGHYDELVEFAESMNKGGEYTIPLWQLAQATNIAFEVEDQIWNVKM